MAAKKNVTGLNAAFAQTTDPSCLNTWLTQGDWDVRALNRQRLAWPQRDPATRSAPSAIIPIDNTLVDHAGKLSEDVGYCWDHAEQRHKIAHHYLLVNSVCPSGTHYALELRRFRKRADCAAPRAELAARPGGGAAAAAQEQRRATFKTHTALWWELSDWVVAEQIPGTFTFASSFTNAPVLNPLHGSPRAYVGDLKCNRKVWVRGVELRATEMAAQIGPEARKKSQMGDPTPCYFTKTIWLPEVNHAVRVVILWE